MTYPLRCVVLRSAKLLDHLIEPAVHVIGACAVLLLELRERLLESRHLAISGRLVPVLALPQALLERSLLAPLEYAQRLIWRRASASESWLWNIDMDGDTALAAMRTAQHTARIKIPRSSTTWDT